ncbi:MAG: pentapeptide repeat-containing protein [Granulosicoccus sp.]|nr:pentapeptide repeat-containing protein [Granulosicoccus sp.]
MLYDFTGKVLPHVSPLQGNSIESDERISFAILKSASIGSQVESADWSDAVIRHSRFESTTLSDCSFDRVVIQDCDLSGVTFRNCLIRNCLISGSKANHLLAFENCIIDRLTIARCRIDELHIVDSRLVLLEFLGLQCELAGFDRCEPHKRNAGGKVTTKVCLTECEITKARGLDRLGESGIKVEVDAELWRELGDHLLKERGFSLVDDKAAASYDILDEIADASINSVRH